MGTISHAFILTLFILTITSSITPNTNAHSSLPYTSSSPSPSPSTSRHPKPHHKPGTGHHHPLPHPHPPTSAPPPYSAKPATPVPPPPPPPKAAKPPTTTYPTPAVPPVKPPPTPTYPTPATPPVKPPTTKPPTPTYPTPAAPPVKPPTTKPPSPTYPTPAAPPATGGKMKYVAVQGMVYCKSNCTYSGINTLLGASPLPGAKVVMRCKNSPVLLRKTAKTDKHGYYFLQAPPLITTLTAAKCKVYLAHKPKSGGPCTLASNLNGGASGAYLYSNNTGPPKPLPTFSLFTVGPFVYEPSKCHKY